MSRLGAIAAAAAAFALYGLVRQPWAWLGWFGLVPWLVTLDRERSIGRAIASGALMSAAFTVGMFSWFAGAFATYTGTPAVLSLALLALAAPVLQPQFLVFAGARHRLRAAGASPLATAVLASCAWVGAEWLLPRLFSDTIGHGQLPFDRLRQLADVAGAAGLTFALVLVNQCLADAAVAGLGKPRVVLHAVVVVVSAAAAMTTYGQVRLEQVSRVVPQRVPLEVAAVQANLSDYDGLRRSLGSFEAVRTILAKHGELSSLALGDRGGEADIDLLVWPETVYPTTYGRPKSGDGAVLDDRLESFVEANGAPLLFGTYDRDERREYNAAVLLQGAGVDEPSVYRKKRLFPLTEEVPAWLDRVAVRRWLPWLGTWQVGEGRSLLPLQQASGRILQLAPLICLDAVDPSLAIAAARDGADLIVTLSNDAWFAGTRGARLHLIVSAFRSIETRLPQLRSTNTGISAFISATGEIESQTAVGEEAVLTARVVPGRRGATLMTAWGDWLGPAAALAAALGLLATLRGRRPDSH